MEAPVPKLPEIKKPEPSPSKPETVKPPIGQQEKKIVDRIDQDGDPDTVLRDIANPPKEESTQKEGKENPDKLDALVVLGRGYNHDQAKRSTNPLNTQSKLNALAAGELVRKGVADKVVMSTGYTKGRSLPSEAEAMKAYLLRHYPDIPESAIIIENESIDTAENAQKVKPILEQLHAQKVGLVTVQDHTISSRQLFENYGVPITNTYASEDVVRQKSPRHARYIEAHKKEPWQKYVKVKEGLRNIAVKTIDPKGNLVRKLTSRLRARQSVDQAETPPEQGKEPQAYTLDELRNPVTRRQFLNRVAIVGSATLATVTAPDVILNRSDWKNIPPEWKIFEEGKPIQVKGGEIRLNGVIHNVQNIEVYKDKIREQIRSAPFVFLEYFDQSIQPNALPTTSDETLKGAKTFGESTNNFYASIGKMCAEEGKDIIVVNPETTNDRYVMSFLTAGLATGTSVDILIDQINNKFKQPITRRNLLKGIGFIPAAAEAAVWSGAIRKIRDKLVQTGIITSDLPENERANPLLAWSILDWRDVNSVKGMEKAVEHYKSEIPSGSIAPAFNGADHKGMAEYLKNPQLREAKNGWYGPYNVVGENSMRRFTYNKEQNKWDLKEKVPY